jgi:hypothetical protein
MLRASFSTSDKESARDRRNKQRSFYNERFIILMPLSPYGKFKRSNQTQGKIENVP